MNVEVERNNCRCHPETCCCNEWAVAMPYGETLTFYRKEAAEKFVKWANECLEDIWRLRELES